MALAFLSVCVLVAIGVQGCLRTEPMPASDAVWGVTFSQKQCASLGLDWRAAYAATVDDLRPAALRLVAYWDLIEPRPGLYDFRDLDRQMAEAERAGIAVSIVIGQKVPRWPEYHFPAWLHVRDARERQARLIAYETEVVRRYRGRPGLRYWQVENEPFLDFGAGPQPDEAFFEREIAAVRRLDPRHRILVTDGGEWGRWVTTARHGDVFGTSLYRSVYDSRFGTFTYPLQPQYYVLRKRLTQFVTGRPGEPYICSELAAEPWGRDPVPQMTLSEQRDLFPPDSIGSTASFARRTGFGEFYFWGVEWWYYRKVHGDASYWEAASQVIRTGVRPGAR